VSWRARSSQIIAKVIAETSGASTEARDKALFDAYPFGVRKYHPYKIWLSEVKRQKEGHAPMSCSDDEDLKKLQEWERIYGKRSE
jgi:hypothetical protein